MKRLLLMIPLIFALFAGPAFARVTTTVGTHDDAKLGTILTDSKRM